MFKKISIVVAFLVVASFSVASPAAAWNCNLPENFGVAECPVPTSVPPTVVPPAQTPIPPTQTSAPTSQPVAPVPTGVPTVIPTVIPTVVSSGRLVAMCHYEPTTGNFEKRLEPPWLVKFKLLLGDTLLTPGGVCAQPTVIPAQPAGVPVATATIVPTVTPTIETVGIQVTEVPVVPTATPVATPTIDESPPEVSTPDALPDTGDPAAKSYCDPQEDSEWMAWWNAIGSEICR